LVLATMVPVSGSLQTFQVEPIPVPAPSPAQPALSRAPAALDQRPAPVPVPAPPGNSVSPQGYAGQVLVLYLFASPALVAAGLLARRMWLDLPLGSPARGGRLARTTREECGA